MVRTETNTQLISNLNARNTGTDVEVGDHVVISSDFQRGDEDTGVWTNNNKSSYIQSLLRKYPAGILTFVKCYGGATSYQEPWKVLDGGNRLRAIRDFMKGEVSLPCGKRIDDLSPKERAEFEAMNIPCQWITISREDPPTTITQMFCRLNTSAVPLAAGELLKSHGWKGDYWEIELAKLFIGAPWRSTIEDQAIVERVSALRERWCRVFGQIGENNRCDNLAMIVGYIISSKMSTFAQFDKRYRTHEPYLTNAPLPTDEQLARIETKIAKFVRIVGAVKEVRDDNLPSAIFGNKSRGVPSRSMVCPIWKPICEDTLDDDQEWRLICFYTKPVGDDAFDVLKRWQGGETSNSRIDGQLNYIYSCV